MNNKFKKEIKSLKIIEKKPGDFNDFPDNLNPEIKRILFEQGITKLYSHQYHAFNLISDNKNTLLVSSTASGKTLSFFLPILNEYLNAKTPFTVLLLYPTKALSRDQENTFSRIMNLAVNSSRIGTFDGDTPVEERNRIQKQADFVITNPDMLHNGILPNNNRRWKVFLSRLRYIVVDEVHTYRGAFGSHVSNIFRRLLRLCDLHGSKPVFVCSSATVGNPKELAENLFHNSFVLVENDGAPKSNKKIYFINPPIIEDESLNSFRKGSSFVSIPLIREAVKNKVRTICFCRARQEVERLYKAVTDGCPEIKHLVKPYRGGLLPQERRSLEKDIMTGKLIGIISTNALELGIDIGDLELCILSGYPGTIASFWQQAGRAGRKANESIVVYIAKDKPIDQYIVHHPEFIIKTPIEQAWLSADNPYILLQHLPCAAYEYPLRQTESYFNSRVYPAALEILKKEKTVMPYMDTLRYALQDYPARGVNIRGMTDYNIEIYCGTTVIGELDPIGARGTLYKDAIYQHLGTKYLSLDLDLDKKLCHVDMIDVDYYTEAVWEGRVEMTEKEESKKLNNADINFGSIYINKQPKLYKKIKEKTLENIGYGPITLPPFEYNTVGISIVPPRDWVESICLVDKRFIGAGLFGLSYLVKNISPMLCMADYNDIDTDVALIHDESIWQSALFIFDTIEGGVGYSEKIYEQLEECLKLAINIIDECECSSGCPSCVPPLPPGINNNDLEELLIESNASIECTKSLLRALIEGKIVMPEIKILKSSISSVVDPVIDEEKIKLAKKLEKAAKNLKLKRERLH